MTQSGKTTTNDTVRMAQMRWFGSDDGDVGKARTIAGDIGVTRAHTTLRRFGRYG
jgi:hypothetical protein